MIRPLQPSPKVVQWRAHDGEVLRVDWNVVSNRIVTGGEDCRFKVWDPSGQLLFSSGPLDHAVTAVSWAPSGDLFAVGTFGAILLCDASGWVSAREVASIGSVTSLSWSSEGTIVAAGGGNGCVAFGQLLETTAEWRNLQICLSAPATLSVTDISSESVEKLEFRDAVTQFSLAFDHLIVATTSQCHIFDVANGGWRSPHIFDVKTTINFILQAENLFLIVDNVSGIQVISYDGRILSSPKFSGMRVECLCAKTVSLSSDVVAVVPRSEPKTVRLFDAASGRPIDGSPIRHSGAEIAEIAFSRLGSIADRKLLMIDRNRDLHIVAIQRLAEVAKMGSVVDSAKWSDTADSLAVIADGRLFVYGFPGVYSSTAICCLSSEPKKTHLNLGRIRRSSSSLTLSVLFAALTALCRISCCLRIRLFSVST